MFPIYSQARPDEDGIPDLELRFISGEDGVEPISEEKAKSRYEEEEGEAGLMLTYPPSFSHDCEVPMFMKCSQENALLAEVPS